MLREELEHISSLLRLDASVDAFLEAWTYNVHSLVGLSKLFYDTFTGAATGAAHCGSFVGRDLWSLGHQLWMNTMNKKIYVVWVVRA
jgi:hypothetical protein